MKLELSVDDLQFLSDLLYDCFSLSVNKISSGEFYFDYYGENRLSYPEFFKELDRLNRLRSIKEIIDKPLFELDAGVEQ